MTLLVLKAVVSGLLIAAASEVARRSTVAGAVIVSLPLTSVLAMIWLYRDTGDADRVAAFSWSVLWVIIPSLAFLVALPVAIRAGAGVAPAMLIAAAVTVVAYVAWIRLAHHLGLDI